VTASVGSADLAADYETAGFARRLGWGRSPALLLVDAVRAYTDVSSPLFLADAAAALGVMAELLGAARSGGRPVIWTTVRHTSRFDAALFRVKVPALAAFAAGSPLAAWPSVIEPGEGDWVVDKGHASAFFGTELASGLVAAGVDTVVVAGYSTSGCVRASALDALQHGFRPMVVADAVADRDRQVHRANLFDLDAKYADVVDGPEAVTRLRGGGR
jgi:maleamate amidohydrolase